MSSHTPVWVSNRGDSAGLMVSRVSDVEGEDGGLVVIETANEDF
jgi:hypothetical protein